MYILYIYMIYNIYIYIYVWHLYLCSMWSQLKVKNLWPNLGSPMIRTSFLQDITEEDCGEDVETPETWRADWVILSSWLMGKAMDIDPLVSLATVCYGKWPSRNSWLIMTYPAITWWFSSSQTVAVYLGGYLQAMDLGHSSCTSTLPSWQLIFLDSGCWTRSSHGQLVMTNSSPWLSHGP